MTNEEAIRRLRDHFAIHDDGRPTPYLDEAAKKAYKALQIADRLEQVRLIDADALKDCFEMRGDSDLGWHLNEVLEEIDEQPTAYEVDKVEAIDYLNQYRNAGNHIHREAMDIAIDALEIADRLEQADVNKAISDYLKDGTLKPVEIVHFANGYIAALADIRGDNNGTKNT